MGMNIKDEETQRLVKRLAKLTGESQTAAITTSVRERLNRLQKQHGQGLAERLMAIGRECAPRIKKSLRSTPHGDLLYGEDGLPK